MGLVVIPNIVISNNKINLQAKIVFSDKFILRNMAILKNLNSHIGVNTDMNNKDLPLNISFRDLNSVKSRAFQKLISGNPQSYAVVG